MQALSRQKEHSPIIATICNLLMATTENLNKGRREEKRKRIHEFRSGCSASLSKRRSIKFHVSVNLHHQPPDHRAAGDEEVLRRLLALSSPFCLSLDVSNIFNQNE